MPHIPPLSALRRDGDQDQATPQAPGTRLERNENGHYFTGLPCKHGHIAWRYKDGNCTVCRRLRDSRKRKERAPDVPYTKLHPRQLDRAVPSAEAIAEAVRAYSAPRANPFADMLGDPPPGRSALDRRGALGASSFPMHKQSIR